MLSESIKKCMVKLYSYYNSNILLNNVVLAYNSANLGTLVAYPCNSKDKSKSVFLDFTMMCPRSVFPRCFPTELLWLNLIKSYIIKIFPQSKQEINNTCSALSFMHQSIGAFFQELEQIEY